MKALADFDAETALLDGEIVVLNEKGLPVFASVISRMHTLGAEAINRAAQNLPASLYLFDMPYLDGLDLRHHTVEKRRRWLQISYKETKALRYSHAFDDGPALFEAIKLQGMEGIICKRKGSPYRSNTRHADWLKIKVRSSEDAYIVGYTRGKGDRSAQFGSLILAQNIENKWVYKGKVGTGFNESKMNEIFVILQKTPTGPKLFKDIIDEEHAAQWLQPQLICEVQYASITPNGTFREPVFVKLVEE